ncbi:Rad9/Ddc1 [Penicillium riverlandense]|uniref:Rad9/Ddc1 n=1 Tax=Penicillium riverlandense TaxID=1903569 RepID=UPI002548C1F5|nr:Rad9/Ddc1 [Penicillium riverlandense]KAJ5805023.1 Rad9/Ddc1 [Penicillium riverlandense]
MTTLSLSLAPPALIQLHDALTCLSKFSETVAIEAEHDLLFFDAYAFSTDANSRAARHHQSTTSSAQSDRFCCQIYIKVCELGLLCNAINGSSMLMESQYRLCYQSSVVASTVIKTPPWSAATWKSVKPATVQHAVFDRTRAINQWTADPRFLRSIIDHFSFSAEQLDMYSDSGKAVFTSFTTKVTEGKEVLKHPVHTSVAIDKKDFADFLVEDKLHVAINLKDFKAVVAHAETMNATVTARYTRPCKPLQLAYEFEGVDAQFTLMTRGEAVEGGDDNVPTSSRASMPQQLSARPTPGPALTPAERARQNPNPAPDMPPPPVARSRSIRPLTGLSTQENFAQKASAEQRPSASSTASASMDFDSLFVPADDDRQWDEMNEEEEPQDILGWDATGQTFQATLRDEEPDFSRLTAASSRKEAPKEEMGIPPTQRMSQVCLLANLVVNSSLTSHSFVVWVFSTELFVYLGL